MGSGFLFKCIRHPFLNLQLAAPQVGSTYALPNHGASPNLEYHMIRHLTGLESTQLM